MKPALFSAIGLLFFSTSALAQDPARPIAAAAASPSPSRAEWVPNAEYFLLKLQDSDPQVRASTIARAVKIKKHDFRVVDLLSRVMNDPSNEAMARLDAAWVVATQETPYAMDGARRVLQLIDEMGYPSDRLEAARTAVSKQGDNIISDMEILASRGELSNNFFRQVMMKIDTSNARVALDRSSSHQSGMDRHTVNR